MKAHEDSLAWPPLAQHLATLRQVAQAGDLDAIKGLLQVCVHGYHSQPDA